MVADSRGTIGAMAPSSKYKLAAGGLVERLMSGGLRLAVVCRTRYGDWVLPKGKPDEDESIEETALREVIEETGCRARIVGQGYSIEYPIGRATKVVTFFRMEFVTDGFAIDPDEIKEVVWLTPRDALARLTYESERSVVRQAYPEP
jgi:8-oxo-dGTP pyrophosphatase MutT (NUDIX family)